MNQDAKQFIRVEADTMSQFIVELLTSVSMPESKARFLADWLVTNDLRGVYSHGTDRVILYLRDLRDGLLNPDPGTSVKRDDGSTIVVDGDGGLGYFPAYEATRLLVDKARTHGIAAAVTVNHGHIGAAGIYSRLLAEHQLIGYVTSGHQLELKPEDSIMEAAGGSPMSFAVPAGEELPMVLDFGAVHDVYTHSPHFSQLFEKAPGVVFRSMGLGFMCQALGGFLAGVPVDKKRRTNLYEGANQGSLMIAIDSSRFLSQEQFQYEMGEYVRTTSQMQPLPGYDRATLPGILEAEREKERRKTGIQVSEQHRESLLEAAAEFGVKAPF
ncbi:Ldh family oxidoreductase [Paenibacillus senegalensis]|uniref:Ldh family oxidoreductase n=1 Tax=Paenibacillus senegalensis TaxID=1465766 RepID=UPI0002885204|nr:Ldh family oxidoreductase [Paenibacillus senegalensis]